MEEFKNAMTTNRIEALRMGAEALRAKLSREQFESALTQLGVPSANFECDGVVGDYLNIHMYELWNAAGDSNGMG